MTKKLTSAKAKEILRDDEVYNHSLSPKQKRYMGWVAGGKKENGGWLDQYEDGGYLGYTTKGRNYSPAWGGQFEDGGNMTYYQHGLDWKPRSMEDGGELEHYPEGGDIQPRQYTESYIQSPLYRKRLESSGYSDIENEIKRRLENVQTVGITDQQKYPNMFEQQYMNQTGKPFSLSGSEYNPEIHNIVYDAQQAKRIGATRNEVLSHELGHAELSKGIDPDINRLNEYDKNQLLNRLKPTVKDKHSLIPDENKADLNSLRYQLKNQGIIDTGQQDITKEYLDKVKSSFIKDRLLKNYSEDDLIWLLNNIAMNKQKRQNNLLAENGSQLQKLDDLTNFTNYNKPADWLSKYE